MRLWIDMLTWVFDQVLNKTPFYLYAHFPTFEVTRHKWWKLILDTQVLLRWLNLTNDVILEFYKTYIFNTCSIFVYWVVIPPWFFSKIVDIFGGWEYWFWLEILLYYYQLPALYKWYGAICKSCELCLLIEKKYMFEDKDKK